MDRPAIYTVEGHSYLAILQSTENETTLHEALKISEPDDISYTTFGYWFRKRNVGELGNIVCRGTFALTQRELTEDEVIKFEVCEATFIRAKARALATVENRVFKELMEED